MENLKFSALTHVTIATYVYRPNDFLKGLGISFTSFIIYTITTKLFILLVNYVLFLFIWYGAIICASGMNLKTTQVQLDKIQTIIY